MSAQDKDPAEDKGWIRANKKYSEIKDLPSGLRPPDMPLFRKKAMPIHPFEMAYISTNWMIIDGRTLIPQEIEGTICKAYDTERQPGDRFDKIHEKVNNRHAKTSTVLEGYAWSKKLHLRRQAQHYLWHYLQDEKPRLRYDFLKGFVGVLAPYPAGMHRNVRPKLAGDTPLYEEQTYFLGALIRWCMPSKVGSIAWENDAAIMFKEKFNLWIPKRFEVYADLNNESHELAQHVTLVLDHPNHADFFGHKARNWHVECSRKKKLRFPVYSYPDIPAESEHLLATTAENVAAMTISAPAGSSRQPTATNPPAGSSHQPITSDFPSIDFDEFLNSEAYEESIAESIASSLHDFDSEPEEAPPAPDVRSPKGKGRARESTSPESQEGGGPGKGKQAAKKPRGGK